MEDSQIVQLYWDRDESAIAASAAKYGGYCAAVAGNILADREDAAECVNDTWLHAWNAMPPHRPRVLSAFLGKLTRNLALDRLRRDTAAKRGGGTAPLVLEELADIVSDAAGGPEAEMDRRELVGAIDAFLGALPREKRQLFLRRYWYFDSIPAIAARSGLTENNVSAVLSRLRRRLRTYLTERGFTL